MTAFDKAWDIVKDDEECDSCNENKPIVARVPFDGPFYHGLCRECHNEHLENTR